MRQLHLEQRNTTNNLVIIDTKILSFVSLDDNISYGCILYYLHLEYFPSRSNQTLAFNDVVSNLCSQHIAERVQIKWNLSGTDIHGIAFLKGITLTQSMIDLCTVSPLQWCKFSSSITTQNIH